MSAKIRNELNFYIDLAMFIVMGALIGLGLLIKYVLLPGQKQWLIYGENMDLTFWGLDRHQWGTIHLILGGVLFVLLVLHIIFYWKTIKCFFRRYIASLGVRSVLSAASVVLFILLAIFPVFVTPQKEPLDRGQGRRMIENMGVDLNDSIRIRLKKPKDLPSGDLEMEIEPKQPRHDIEVKGRMTLDEVCREFGVELTVMKEKLDLPGNVSGTERLGRLRKRYGFAMGDVKTIIIEHGE